MANRRFLGIDQENEYLEISKNRKLEIEDLKIASKYKQKIQGFNNQKELDTFLDKEPKAFKNIEFPFKSLRKHSQTPNITPKLKKSQSKITPYRVFIGSYYFRHLIGIKTYSP